MHSGAFGVSIPDYNIDKFIEKMNEYYDAVPKEPIYWVDFIWTQGQMFGDIIKTIAQEMQEFWGQEIPEPLVCIKDIDTANCGVQLLSADKHPTLKVRLPNGVDLMKFGSSQEEWEEWSKPGKLLTVIGTPNINEWNGNITAQVLVEDYEITEGWRF